MWFAPVGLLTVFAGYVGYRLGQPLSEGDVIVHWAQHYVETTKGSAVTDCAARPDARGHVWLVLTCVDPSSDSAPVIYEIGPHGGLVGDAAVADLTDAQT